MNPKYYSQFCDLIHQYMKRGLTDGASNLVAQIMNGEHTNGVLQHHQNNMDDIIEAEQEHPTVSDLVGLEDCY